MNILRIRNIVAACRQIAFPQVCICCGLSLYHPRRFLCDECRLERFEHPLDQSSEILPASVQHHYALWTFDKGGYMQELLHTLKYQHLSNLGRELGQYLANSYIDSPEYRYLETRSSRRFLLIPVPLHKKKQRKRGYNQARVIAEGIASVTGWKMAPEGMLIRIRNTKTQTGLTTEERMENVNGAFEWGSRESINSEIPVLIDDVFTTGATVFELAGMLMHETAKASVILTLAKA